MITAIADRNTNLPEENSQPLLDQSPEQQPRKDHIPFKPFNRRMIAVRCAQGQARGDILAGSAPVSF